MASMPSDGPDVRPGGRSAEIEELLSSAGPQELEALLENPGLDETHVCRLLARKDLSTTLLERVASRKEWLGSRQIRVALIAHPHTPRRIALRLAREVYLMDLVSVSLAPSTPVEVRRFVEDLLLARLSQLPLGQKLVLARRGPARVAGGLLADGHEQVAKAAIENGRLTEAQVLRVLAGSGLSPQVIAVIGRHPRWSALATVRAAIVRHARTPLQLALLLVPSLARHDLEEFAHASFLRPEIRKAVTQRLSVRPGDASSGQAGH